MIREWADEDTRDQIDDALATPAAALAATWDDDEAWEMFESAMNHERGNRR